jgi:outer membrane protein TolC
MDLDEAERLLPVPAEVLPQLAEGSATGRPRDLVATRPELRAARARLAAAQETLRGAWLQALPTLSLSANAGGQIYASDDLSSTETWGFGANISVPIFRGLRERAAVREAQADVSAAQHALEGALIQAVSQVEGAIASEREQREQLQANLELLEAARLAFQVSRDSYIEGVSSYLMVMSSLASLQVAELTIIQNQRAVISARLGLYQALGGSWTRGLAPGDVGEE